MDTTAPAIGTTVTDDLGHPVRVLEVGTSRDGTTVARVRSVFVHGTRGYWVVADTLTA